MTHFECDVAIVGAGPTGLTLANFLGAAGVRVVLIERNTTTVQEPRAVSIDDESLRTMQALGLVDEVLKDVALDYGSHYLAPDGSCFAKVEPTTREYGFPRRNAFLQPRLEATLRNGLNRFPNITQLFEHLREDFAEDDSGVTLGLRGPNGGAVSVRAAYFAACDGGRSPTREALGIALSGSTYDQRWLIVDLASTKEMFRQTQVFCNPVRPALGLPGPHGTRRYEFMMREGETEEEVTSPEFVRRLLAAHGPDSDAPVVRRAVYHFHARIADRWQTRRIFLAGDAAHLSPPFAGQGMNSGIRDAHNLAWKLAQVVQGGLGPGLLETYEEERRPHARALIELAVNMGRVMMPASRTQARLVQSGFKLARFVSPLQAYFAEMKYKPKPRYQIGFVIAQKEAKMAGRMLPQPRLDLGENERILLDDLIGNEFALIAYGPGAEEIIRTTETINFGLRELRRVAVVPKRQNPNRSLELDFQRGRDVDDLFGSLPRSGTELLIVLRPDRYVAGMANVDDRRQISLLASSVQDLASNTWEKSAFAQVAHRPAAE